MVTRINLLDESVAELADSIFRDAEIPADGTAWSVLHTWPRSEKVVAQGLLRHSVAFFLPLFHREVRRQRRIVRTHFPLFPGYLFLRTPQDARLPHCVENRVVNRLPVENQQRIHADLHAIHGLIHSGQPLCPEERLEPGQAAEIIAGPLRGYRGTVVRRASSRRFVVEVNFLSQGASVEVSPDQIRAVF
jgi:transcription antitermination factor NusG